MRAYEDHHSQVPLCPRQPPVLTVHHMHNANRPPSTRHRPAFRTRPAQLTPRCARRLAGSLSSRIRREYPRRRCSRHPPRSGGAAAAQGVAAGSAWGCVCPLAHPRLRHIADCPHGRPAQICRRGCGAVDAPAARHAWGGRGPLRWSLHLCFGGACGMWPGLSRAKNPAVRMAVWPSPVARGRHEALDSLNLPLY